MSDHTLRVIPPALLNSLRSDAFPFLFLPLVVLVCAIPCRAAEMLSTSLRSIWGSIKCIISSSRRRTEHSRAGSNYTRTTRWDLLQTQQLTSSRNSTAWECCSGSCFWTMRDLSRAGSWLPTRRRGKLLIASVTLSEPVADSVLARSPQDRNALLRRSWTQGLRSDYMALIEKRYLASRGIHEEGRDSCPQLLANDPTCYDANLAIGVENYILGLKPAPLRWLLRMYGARDR